MIPSADDQPSVDRAYDPSKPATFTPELDDPAHYPAALDTAAPAGTDPIGAELRATYGTSAVYGMHWLLDVDDWYGFGRHADGKTAPSFINTFQRGPLESVWETIPQPCWDGMNWGGPHGYLDLFVRDSDTAQWKYSVAPDADARAIEAIYWALRWADEAGSKPALLPLAQKAAKLGDYLRYSFLRQVLQAPRLREPRLQRQRRRWAPRRSLSPLLVLRLGSPRPARIRVVVAHRFELGALRLPEPDGGLRPRVRPRDAPALAAGRGRAGTGAS